MTGITVARSAQDRAGAGGRGVGDLNGRPVGLERRGVGEFWVLSTKFQVERTVSPPPANQRLASLRMRTEYWVLSTLFHATLRRLSARAPTRARSHRPLSRPRNGNPVFPGKTGLRPNIRNIIGRWKGAKTVLNGLDGRVRRTLRLAMH